MMFHWLQNWRHRRIVSLSTIDELQWSRALGQLPILSGLSAAELAELKRLVILFLHHKSLEGAHGLVVTREMSLIIALQACLPILHLGLDWYDGWVSIIVYPAQFVPDRVYVDEYGIEHSGKSVLSGESWHKGPLVLSWEDSEHSGAVDGYNVVIHEFAHKLDVLNGRANGFPPLHKDMSAAQWTQVMERAFKDFLQRIESGATVPIDAYAGTSPAEFFAVLSEVFFERPRILHGVYPQVYDQFRFFYRQDPLARLR
jgi:Mlc titration factor MtfA (ptsG expression regulator)